PVCSKSPTVHYPPSLHDALPISKMKAQYGDRVHFLLGNHELSEITDYPIQKNKQMLNLLFRLGMQQMYGSAADKVRESFVPFVQDRKSTRLNSSHVKISYAVFCL